MASLHLDTYLEAIVSNTIEVFFQIDSHGERVPPTSCKATLEDTQALGSSFEQNDIGHKGFHVALNKNYEKIFVMFGGGLKLIYGNQIGDIKTTKIASFRIRTSVGHLGHGLESITVEFRWSYIKKALLPLFKDMGAITRAQRILLAAIDLECLQEYEKILGKCLDHRTSFETDEQECFTLRACLVNVFTEPHVDGRDVKNGWASMYPLGIARFPEGDPAILKDRSGSVEWNLCKRYKKDEGLIE
ncbi:hypothetical protein B9Z19DRAFT_1121178 [Tuber borchii]|uniref:Uncharacterized protein n=1 Tax=Tuber borchii TaxID=42251 RepID=A0A2T7A330_TUBBO|nr:hypothetical protein B9Z19DRAFT_1121178 [Tuber borchii]